MKHSRYLIISIFLFLFAMGASARNRPFGLGVIVGEPSGLSAKLWVSPTSALDFGLGWSIAGSRVYDNNDRYYGRDRVHFHMDYLWHWFNAIRSSEQFPLYTGIGGKVHAGAGYKASVAARGVFGIAWIPHTVPIDIFLEVAPTLQVVPSTGFGVDVGLGVRYYF